VTGSPIANHCNTEISMPNVCWMKLAATAFRDAQPVLHSGVNKGVVHRNTAARKISRLSARIKALAVTA